MHLGIITEVFYCSLLSEKNSHSPEEESSREEKRWTASPSPSNRKSSFRKLFENSSLSSSKHLPRDSKERAEGSKRESSIDC